MTPIRLTDAQLDAAFASTPGCPVCSRQVNWKPSEAGMYNGDCECGVSICRRETKTGRFMWVTGYWKCTGYDAGCACDACRRLPECCTGYDAGCACDACRRLPECCVSLVGYAWGDGLQSARVCSLPKGHRGRHLDPYHGEFDFPSSNQDENK